MILEKVKENNIIKAPKSFIKLLKFYRIFGYSFSGVNFESNETKLTKIKRFLLIFYNVLAILLLIGLQIFSTYYTSVEFNNLRIKKVMKTVFATNRLMSYSEIIVGYIISLIRGRQILKIFDEEEFGAIDRNTRKVNKISILLTIVIIIIGTSFGTILNSKLNPYIESVGTLMDGVSIKRILILILSFTFTIFYFNGALLLSIFYYYTTSLIITQINELESGITKSFHINKHALKLYRNYTVF